MKSPILKFYTFKNYPNGFSDSEGRYLIAKGRHWYYYDQNGRFRIMGRKSYSYRVFESYVKDGSWIEVPKEIIKLEYKTKID